MERGSILMCGEGQIISLLVIQIIIVHAVLKRERLIHTNKP